MKTYQVEAKILFKGESQTKAGAEHVFRKDIAKQIAQAFPGRTVQVGVAKEVSVKKTKEPKTEVIEVKTEEKKTPKKDKKVKAETKPKKVVKETSKTKEKTKTLKKAA